MSAQEIVNKAYRELAFLSETPAAAFAAERNGRFRRLLKHHVHNRRNTAYADLWRSHGLDPARDVAIDLADVESLPLVDRDFLNEADYRATRLFPTIRLRTEWPRAARPPVSN